MLKVIFKEKLLHNFWIYIQFTYIQFMSFQVFASILMAYNYKLAYSNLTEVIIEKKVMVVEPSLWLLFFFLNIINQIYLSTGGLQTNLFLLLI